MIYRTVTKLTDRGTGDVFIVDKSDANFTSYQGAKGKGAVNTPEVSQVFIVDEGGAMGRPEAATVSALDVQEGGDHYKKLGEYQPWEVLRRWLTPEEFRGYMKGTAIAYLAREQDKGGHAGYQKGRPHAPRACRIAGG